MTLGNQDIAKFIELGHKAKSVYEAEINGETIKLTWRPVRIYERREALSNAISKVPREIANWILAEKEERQKIIDSGVKIPRSHINKFERWLALYTIHAAMEEFYPGLTVEQVSNLDIDIIACIITNYPSQS